MVEQAMFNVQRAITPKVHKPELRFISEIEPKLNGRHRGDMDSWWQS